MIFLPGVFCLSGILSTYFRSVSYSFPKWGVFNPMPDKWLSLTPGLTVTTSLRIDHIPSPNWAEMSTPESDGRIKHPSTSRLILDPASPNWGPSRPILGMPGPDGIMNTWKPRRRLNCPKWRLSAPVGFRLDAESCSPKTGARSASDRIHPSWDQIRLPCVNGLSGYHPRKHAHYCRMQPHGRKW